MPVFFASPRLFARLARDAALLAALVAAPGLALAEETNPVRAVTNAAGLTAPTGERPDFVRESRPAEESMDYVSFIAPQKKRIPVKTPEQAAADDADLVATKTKAQDRLRKLQAEKVDQLAPAPKPPPVTDKF